MTLSLILTLIGIGIVDSLNPSLFIAQFYLLTTPKPAPRILAYIFGVWVVMVVGGLLILSGFRTIVSQIINGIPPEVGVGLQLVVGVALVIFGLWYRAKPAEEGEAQKPHSYSLWAGFLLGMVVMINEISTALPYFIAIERIADAQLSWQENVFAILWYNMFFSLPLFAFLGGFLLLKDRFMQQINVINAWIRVWTPRILKYGALILGILAIADVLL
jgi:cytochrome c biogenesis protein CcdA